MFRKEMKPKCNFQVISINVASIFLSDLFSDIFYISKKQKFWQTTALIKTKLE